MKVSTPIRDLASLGGLTRAAMYDGRQVTQKARDVFRASFLAGHRCSLCPAIVIPRICPSPSASGALTRCTLPITPAFGWLVGPEARPPKGGHPMTATNRPEGRPATTAGNNVSTFLTEPATLGEVMLLTEIDLTESARKLEWAGVVEPAFRREAQIVFTVVRRLRGERLRAA